MNVVFSHFSRIMNVVFTHIFISTKKELPQRDLALCGSSKNPFPDTP